MAGRVASSTRALPTERSCSTSGPTVSHHEGVGRAARSQLAAFFALAYAISWLFWAPLWLPAFGIHGLRVLPFQHALGALGPIVAADVVSAAQFGLRGPADLLRRMVDPRGRLLGWIAVALLGPVALYALAVAGARLAGTSASLADLGHSREFPQFTALGFLAYNVVSFGFGEEAGWRGFALPRLQSRHSALIASVLLTVGWAVWHVPLFFYRPGYTSMSAAGIAGWFVSLLTGSILLTALYNGSRGSILVVALFHASMDVAFTSDVASPLIVNVLGALVTVCAVGVVAATRPRTLSPSGTRLQPSIEPSNHRRGARQL